VKRALYLSDFQQKVQRMDKQPKSAYEPMNLICHNIELRK